MEIKVTPEEEAFRKQRLSDVKSYLKAGNVLECSSCFKPVASVTQKTSSKGSQIYSHPLLEILMCQPCVEFYTSSEFSFDEDGFDKYCRLCGEGGTLYFCSKCPSAFCKGCLKFHCSSEELENVEKDDWQCFVCDVKPLWPARALCWFLMQDGSKENSRPTKSTLSSMDSESDNLSNDDDNTVPKFTDTKSKSKKRECSDGAEKDTPSHTASKISLTPNQKMKKNQAAGPTGDKKNDSVPHTLGDVSVLEVPVTPDLPFFVDLAGEFAKLPQNLQNQAKHELYLVMHKFKNIED